jgi:cation diffusion facilitator family transporter
MEGHGGSRIAVIAAVIGNLAIAVVKFIAGAITGSSAMISEGIHSLVDTGNGGLLLLGMREARQPADEGHPFGHGKALYFWTLVVSVSIFGIGGGMSLFEGVSHIRHVAPEASMSDPTISYIVLAISAAIEAGSFSVAIRGFWKAKGDKSPWQYIVSAKDPSTYTVVLEDSAALLGLIFAFLGIFLGHLLKNPYLDGTASIMIGLLLMGVAFFLASQTKGLLLGEGADPAMLADIRRRAESDPSVERVAEILTMYMGPYEVLVNLGVVFKPGTTAEQTHEAIHRIERDVQGTYPECTRLYFEAESLSERATGQRRAEGKE